VHIAVNTRLLQRGKLEGIGRFSHEILQRMVHQHPEVRFTFLFDRPYADDFLYGPNVEAVQLFPPGRHPLLYLALYEGPVSWALARLKPDVYFSPDAYLSLSLTNNVPQVPVFHDLAWLHVPEAINGWHRWYYQTWFPKFARKAAHIITVSEHARQDMLKEWNMQEDQISLVYNGANIKFQPVDEAGQQAARDRFAQGCKYFLYVGALQPRKNIPNLMKAYDAFREQYQTEPYRLVLAGRDAWLTEDIHQTHQAMRHKDEVIYVGHRFDRDLNELYNGATALTYISKFEGFGLPVLEAQHAETPVLTSNRTSLPEVAGDAALIVDPFDLQGITQALFRLATDANLRADLIAKGRDNKHRFSWDKSANRAFDILQRVAEKHRNKTGKRA
jgi:glycosyltransferase involved in cell wall biosynthesis